VLGSIAYVAEKWLAGGLLYFAGGVLAFPSLYQSTLAELVENNKLLYKLHAVVPEIQYEEEQLDSGINDISLASDLTEASSEERQVDMAIQKLPRGSSKSDGLHKHKRLSSDNAIFAVSKLPIQARSHKRAPTCPADLFKRTSSFTCETASLTDTECTVSTDQVSTRTSFLGKDIHIALKAEPQPNTQLHYYDAFMSFSKDEPNFESSFRVIKRLSQSNLIDVTLASQKTSSSELRRTAFWQQFYLPSLYISIAYMIGGFLFTIGECSLGFSPLTIQNIYLSGSSLYFMGSAGILYRAWANVRDEWDLLQESRMALYAMTYPDETDT
jgi:hypothetical protein